MSNDKIKVAIVGVGNCASSFVQGVEHYSNNDDEDGLISDVIGGYKVSDIEVVAAYDINSLKVGKDLSEAIFAEPNNTITPKSPIERAEATPSEKPICLLSLRRKTHQPQ